MREYRFYDAEKATWGDGPWLQEPDKIQWIDDATGLDCLAVRNMNMGFWCGYVGVADGHPAFEKPYDDVDVEVHGGLTFSDFCMEGKDAERLVCHIAEPGRPDRVWWLGYDCGHAYDLAPGIVARERTIPGMERFASLHQDDVYRSLEYVKAECRDLAQQLAALA